MTQTTKAMNKDIKDYLGYYIGQKVQNDYIGGKKIIGTIKGFVNGFVAVENYDVFGDAWNDLTYLDMDQFKLVLRPLSSMTKEDLKTVFSKVSLYDLSNAEFEYGEDGGEKWLNAHLNGVVFDAIAFNGNVFGMMNNDGTFDQLNPMTDAFHILLKFGFDLFNLIESGLAIDASTLNDTK